MIEGVYLNGHGLSFRRSSMRACAALADAGFVCYNARRCQFNTNGPRSNAAARGETYMTSRRAAIVLIAIGVSAFASIGGASALDYPTRPVRFVVGYPPGGATDIIARLIAQRLSER